MVANISYFILFTQWLTFFAKKSLLLLMKMWGIRTYLIIFTTLVAHTSIAQTNVLKLDQWHNDSIIVGAADVRYNECWGFTHNNNEYAVLGSTEGTHFFRITENSKFQFIDFIPGKFSNQSVVHRDFHDAYGYLYASCDEGNSSLQIMDLQYLPDSVHLAKDTTIITRAHNIFIDKSRALLYACSPTPQGKPLLIFDIEDPLFPKKIDFNEAILPDQVHDIYVKNDQLYMFGLYTGLHIYEFDKSSASLVKIGDLEFYQDQGECHSGWTTPNDKYLFFIDETNGSRIKVCDISNLPNAKIVSLFGTNYENGSVPHNIMIRGNFAYVSYYNEGLRVYNITNPEKVIEVGNYDTYDIENEYKLHGAWGIYALLPSGRLIVSDRQSGLFLFDFLGDDTAFTNLSDDGVQIRHSSWNQALYIAIDNDWEFPMTLIITDASGKLVYSDSNIQDNYIRITTNELSNGPYIIKINNENGRETSKKFVIMQY